MFALEKTTIVEGNEKQYVERWQPNAKSLRHYHSIAELLEKEGEFLSQLGWHIEVDKDYLASYRKFKNGKPLKSFEVSLGYEEYTYDLSMDEDGNFLEVKRKKVKPWTLRAKNQYTRSYGNFGSAASVFLDLADSIAPIKKMR